MVRKALICLLVGVLWGCAERRPEFPFLVECAEPAEGDVAVTWMGAAGLYVTDGETGLLIDPFVSRRRASALRVLSGRPVHSDPEIVGDWLERLGPVDAVLVSHSHYDHALDVPAFAVATGASAYGGVTTGLIMEGHGAPSHFKPAQAGSVFEFPPFIVEFVRSDHARGLPVDFAPGEARKPIPPGSPATDYKMGDVFALRITHRQGAMIFLGTGGAVEDQFAETGGAEVAFLSLSARTPGPLYLRETVAKTGVRKVVPIHFDDLFSLPRTPPRIQSVAKFADFADELAAIDREIGFAPQPQGRACAIFK